MDQKTKPNRTPPKTQPICSGCPEPLKPSPYVGRIWGHPDASTTSDLTGRTHPKSLQIEHPLSCVSLPFPPPLVRICAADLPRPSRQPTPWRMARRGRVHGGPYRWEQSGEHHSQRPGVSSSAPVRRRRRTSSTWSSPHSRPRPRPHRTSFQLRNGRASRWLHAGSRNSNSHR